jgi:hypothetical protein
LPVLYFFQFSIFFPSVVFFQKLAWCCGRCHEKYILFPRERKGLALLVRFMIVL